MYPVIQVCRIAEHDTQVVPASDLTQDGLERRIIKIEETLHPLSHCKRVNRMHIDHLTGFVPASILSGLQTRHRLIRSGLHHFHTTFDQRHMCLLVPVIPEVEFRTQHTHPQAVRLHIERCTFIVCHLEEGLSVQDYPTLLLRKC